MIERIESFADPRLDEYRNLTDGQLRRGSAFLVEGRLVVRTLLTAGRYRPRSVLVTASAFESLRDVLEAGRGRSAGDLPVYLAEQDLVNRVVGFNIHRGCLAAADRGEGLSPSGLIGSLPRGPATVVVLEQVNNHDNVGAVFRNAAAFGAAGVLLSPGCVDPLYRKAVRVSMGGVLRVPFAAANDEEWAGVAALLRGAGFVVVALSPRAEAEGIQEFEARSGAERVALLLGAEGAGLTREAEAWADVIVRIPLVDGVDSLNVATAGAIALHRLARRSGS